MPILGIIASSFRETFNFLRNLYVSGTDGTIRQSNENLSTWTTVLPNNQSLSAIGSINSITRSTNGQNQGAAGNNNTTALFVNMGVAGWKWFQNAGGFSGSNINATSRDGDFDRLSNWTARQIGANPTTFFTTLVWGFEYGNGIFTAIGTNFQSGIGNSRMIAYSPATNGASWTFPTVPFTNTPRAMFFGNGLWIGGDYGGLICTSTDFITWTSQTSNFGTTAVMAMTYGAGIWAAGGYGGRIRTSTDGVTWTTQTSNFGNYGIIDIRYGNGIFVAVGNGGRIRTSTDAVTWVTQTANFGVSQCRSVDYGNGLWVAVGNGGRIRTSTNAVTWVTQTSNMGTQYLQRVRYGNGLWIVGGYTRGALVRTSTNGSLWTTPTGFSDRNNVWNLSMVYGNGVWLVGGEWNGNGNSHVSTEPFNNSFSTISSSSGTLTKATQTNDFYYENTWTTITISLASTSVPTTGDTKSIASTTRYRVIAGTSYLLSSDRYSDTFNNFRSVYNYPGSTWTAATSNIGNTSITGLSYGNSAYVALGVNGSVRTSTDAITWTTRTSNLTVGYDLVYGNGVHVAVANGQIRTSTDGVAWTTRTSNFGITAINEIDYGNGLFVAVGDSGTLRTSTDGVTWTTQTSNFPVGISAIKYGNGLWVAGGQPSSSRATLRTSTDGITWVTRTMYISTSIEAIGYGNGTWIAGGSSGGLLRSTDAVLWTPIQSNFGANTISSIEYGNGNWIMGGGSGLAVARRSKDSILWTTINFPFPSQVSATLYQNGSFLLGGGGGALYYSNSTDSPMFTNTVGVANMGSITNNLFGLVDNNLYYQSSDTQTWITKDLVWTTVTSNFTATTQIFISYGNGLWVANQSNGQIRTSTDLLTWNTRTSNVSILASPKFGGTSEGSPLWIASSSPNILRSTDAVSWTTQNANFGSSSLNTVSYGNGLWVAAGAWGQIRTSTDGITWTTRASNANAFWNTGIYGNGLYLVAGNNNLVTSTDGTTWTNRTINLLGGNGIAYGQGIYVIVSSTNSSNGIRTSTDAITWTTRTNNIGQYISQIDYGNGIFVVISESGPGFSTDGITWSTTRPTNIGPSDISYGNGVFVVSGADPAIKYTVDPRQNMTAITENIVGTDKGTVHVYNSSTGNFTQRSLNNTNANLNSVSILQDKIAAKDTSNVVYASENNGVSWITVTTSLPTTSITAISVGPIL